MQSTFEFNKHHSNYNELVNKKARERSDLGVFMDKSFSNMKDIDSKVEYFFLCTFKAI